MAGHLHLSFLLLFHHESRLFFFISIYLKYFIITIYSNSKLFSTPTTTTIRIQPVIFFPSILIFDSFSWLCQVTSLRGTHFLGYVRSHHHMVLRTDQAGVSFRTPSREKNNNNNTVKGNLSIVTYSTSHIIASVNHGLTSLHHVSIYSVAFDSLLPTRLPNSLYADLLLLNKHKHIMIMASVSVLVRLTI